MLLIQVQNAIKLNKRLLFWTKIIIYAYIEIIKLLLNYSRIFV